MCLNDIKKKRKSIWPQLNKKNANINEIKFALMDYWDQEIWKLQLFFLWGKENEPQYYIPTGSVKIYHEKPQWDAEASVSPLLSLGAIDTNRQQTDLHFDTQEWETTPVRPALTRSCRAMEYITLSWPPTAAAAAAAVHSEPHTCRIYMTQSELISWRRRGPSA